MVPIKGAQPRHTIGNAVKLSMLFFLLLIQTGRAKPGGPGQGVSDMLISIELRNVLLRDALNKIGDKAHVSFVYVNNKAIDKSKVSITAHRQKMGKVLDRLLRPYSLGYTVVDNRVIVWQMKNH